MSPVEGPQQRQQSRGQAGRRPAQRTGKRGRENRGRQLISTEDIVLDLKPEKQPRQKKKSSDSRSDTPAKTGLREIQRRGDRRERAAATSAAPPGGANINGGPPGIIKPFPMYPILFLILYGTFDQCYDLSQNSFYFFPKTFFCAK